jgi:hypothetical protein
LYSQIKLYITPLDATGLLEPFLGTFGSGVWSEQLTKLGSDVQPNKVATKSRGTIFIMKTISVIRQICDVYVVVLLKIKKN